MDNKNKSNQEESLNINYVISTYGGVSCKREKYDNGLTPDTLKLHLQKLLDLLKTTTHVSQVTVVKPIIQGASYPGYYDIDKEIKDIQELDIRVEIVDTVNKIEGLSYSQWRSAYERFPNFDWYIVTEDDWLPNCPEFDSELLRNWKRKVGDLHRPAYMSLWYGSTHSCHVNHAVISVGIISKGAFELLKTNVSDDVELNQKHFSIQLKRHGAFLTDYSDMGDSYRLLFWHSSHGTLFDYSKGSSQKTIFVPIQFEIKPEGFKIVKKFKC